MVSRAFKHGRERSVQDDGEFPDTTSLIALEDKGELVISPVYLWCFSLMGNSLLVCPLCWSWTKFAVFWSLCCSFDDSCDSC